MNRAELGQPTGVVDLRIMEEVGKYHYSGIPSMAGVTARMWRLFPETVELEDHLDFGSRILRINYRKKGEFTVQYTVEAHRNRDQSHYLVVYQRK